MEMLLCVVRDIFLTWGGGGGVRKELVTENARVTASQE
jgi:hypothetical protein